MTPVTSLHVSVYMKGKERTEPTCWPQKALSCFYNMACLHNNAIGYMLCVMKAQCNHLEALTREQKATSIN